MSRVQENLLSHSVYVFASQVLYNELQKRGVVCRCIRCREVKDKAIDVQYVHVQTEAAVPVGVYIHVYVYVHISILGRRGAAKEICGFPRSGAHCAVEALRTLIIFAFVQYFTVAGCLCSVPPCLFFYDRWKPCRLATSQFCLIGQHGSRSLVSALLFAHETGGTACRPTLAEQARICRFTWGALLPALLLGLLWAGPPQPALASWQRLVCDATGSGTC